MYLNDTIKLMASSTMNHHSNKFFFLNLLSFIINEPEKFLNGQNYILGYVLSFITRQLCYKSFFEYTYLYRKKFSRNTRINKSKHEFKLFLWYSQSANYQNLRLLAHFENSQNFVCFVKIVLFLVFRLTPCFIVYVQRVPGQKH